MANIKYHDSRTVAIIWKNYWRWTNPINLKKLTLLAVIAVLCSSCGSTAPEPDIKYTIHVYKDEIQNFQGVYFNEPYEYSYDYKTFLEFLDLGEHNVDSIRIALLDTTRLKIVRYRPLNTETNIIKGTLVNGVFQLKNEKHWFGIPLLLYSRRSEQILIYLGLLDEIIVQHSKSSTGHFFGKVDSESFTDYYHYSKTDYKVSL